MANRVLAPIQQILTSAGALASGYQLFVYQSGTTTKQAIYPTATDADGASNALTNPIVLNSRGEASSNGSTPTSVYVPDATTSVKLVLALGTDSDPPSSPVRTEDTIKLVAATAVASVSSSVIPTIDNTYDLGSSSFEWRNLWIDGTANIDALVADTADINAGTMDAVVIGGSTPAAATFTDLTATGTITINGIPTVVHNTSDQGQTSSTLANVTSLVLPVVSGSYYHFKFVVAYMSDTLTNGVKLGVTTPTFGTNDFNAQVAISTGVPGLNSGMHFGALAASGDNAASSTVAIVSTAYIATVEGTILPTANGNIQLQFASEDNTNTTTILKGSCGFLTKLV